MAKKKKEQAVQDKPVQAATNEVKGETCPSEKHGTEDRHGTENRSKGGCQCRAADRGEKERKPREPQMVTADGGKSDPRPCLPGQG